MNQGADQAAAVTSVAVGTEKQLNSVIAASNIVNEMVSGFQQTAKNSNNVAQVEDKTSMVSTQGKEATEKEVQSMPEV